jgi:ketosteroid isomerase-like protein
VDIADGANHDRQTMSDTSTSSVDLVLAYIAAARRARETQDPHDFDLLRSFLSDDLVIRQASPWADDPWQVIHRDAESLIRRLQAPSNAGAVLHTETVNAVAAGDEVLVEQVSTITTSDRAHVSSVCFLFSVTDGRITGGRLYRNDAGLPTG